MISPPPCLTNPLVRCRAVYRTPKTVVWDTTQPNRRRKRGATAHGVHPRSRSSRPTATTRWTRTNDLRADANIRTSPRRTTTISGNIAGRPAAKHLRRRLPPAAFIATTVAPTVHVSPPDVEEETVVSRHQQLVTWAQLGRDQ